MPSEQEATPSSQSSHPEHQPHYCKQEKRTLVPRLSHYRIQPRFLIVPKSVRYVADQRLDLIGFQIEGRHGSTTIYNFNP